MSKMTPIQAALWGCRACRSLPAEVVRLGNFWVEFARTYDALAQAQAHIEALEKALQFYAEGNVDMDATTGKYGVYARAVLAASSRPRGVNGTPCPIGKEKS